MTLFLFSLCAILITWVGYPLLLVFISKVFWVNRSQQCSSSMNPKLSVCIIVSAFNEEKNIEQRIKNLLQQNLDDSIELHIHIGSDGSTDRTAELVQNFTEKNIHLHKFKREGRATVHNEIVSNIESEILIFTDAETEFEENFIYNITKPFRFEEVGVVVGNLFYKNTGSDSNQAESVYWKYEKFIRKLEEECGILANGTGAAMAVRRSLYNPIESSEDVDSAIPIDAHAKGFQVIYCWDAIAYDYTIESDEQAFHSKIRGASQTMLCWKNRITLGLIFQNKLLFLSFLFHRFFRYSTFIFIIVCFLSIGLSIYNKENEIFNLVFLLLSSLVLIGGSIFQKKQNNGILKRLAVFSYLFFVSSLGMFIGMIKGLINKSSSIY